MSSTQVANGDTLTKGNDAHMTDAKVAGTNGAAVDVTENIGDGPDGEAILNSERVVVRLYMIHDVYTSFSNRMRSENRNTFATTELN